MTDSLRVALVHERFTELGGSERVVEQLHALWPQAKVVSPVVDRRALPAGLLGADIQTSPLQRLYRGGPTYAHLLPLLPLAMAASDLGPVDLVITSHHAFANRVRCPPGAALVSYTHTPGRWLWDRSIRGQEMGSRAGRMALGALAATQRRPDRRAAQRPDVIAVNSRHVADRVARWWGRSAAVVPPPVDVHHYTPGDEGKREDFFLMAGRLVPYKRPEVAVLAARQAGVRLVVVGAGRCGEQLTSLAGPGIELLGAVDDERLRDLYRRCRALVFPGIEDFGLVPVEAQACGTPVLALGAGGVLDSVLDGTSGTLYRPGPDEPDVDALARALRAFDSSPFDAAVIRRHAESFSREAFRERMSDVISAALGTTSSALATRPVLPPG